jgi:ribosomal-protein-alanine N-acetyltransferase
MADIVIRRMVLADVSAVAGMEQEIFSDPWSRNVFVREARGGEDTWTRVAVTARGEVVGYMVAWFVADEVHLANLAVHPDHRRGGLGRRFLEELEDRGRQREARMVVLEVRRSNAAAQTLYRTLGYYPITIRRRYYADNREDAVVMIKPLTEAGRIAPAPDPES